jgi:hypothetical protein
MRKMAGESKKYNPYRMQKIQDTIKAIIHELYQIDFTPEISPAPKPELGEYCVNIFPIVKIA